MYVKVLPHNLEWDKWALNELIHSRQWFNQHLFHGRWWSRLSAPVELSTSYATADKVLLYTNKTVMYLMKCYRKCAKYEVLNSAISTTWRAKPQYINTT